MSAFASASNAGEEFHAFAAAQAFIDSLPPERRPDPRLPPSAAASPTVALPHRRARRGRTGSAARLPVGQAADLPARSRSGARCTCCNSRPPTGCSAGRSPSLKAIGAWDRSLVVLTADHGVSFPFQRYASRSNFDQILWTPLFVKAPGQDGRRDRPTVLRCRSTCCRQWRTSSGSKIPWKIDGRSLRGAPRTDGRRPFMHSDAGLGVPATFPGRLGFARVLRARAAPPGGDARLRIYRIGPYGRLVGQAVEPL